VRTLHRLYDPRPGGLQDMNRDTACPPSYPRPPGRTCDEYPFASSLEGAWTSPYKVSTLPGTYGPRTFPWCGITLPEPNSTGLKGYSACMIDGWQNSVGGGEVGTFYDRDRVLPGDNFYVRITP